MSGDETREDYIAIDSRESRHRSQYYFRDSVKETVTMKRHFEEKRWGKEGY